MPAGADAVSMQEDVHVEADAVIVPVGLKRGANRRLAGEDVRAGSILLPAGRRLAAQDVALAAAVGLKELAVRRRVRVAVFSTGNEVVEPDDRGLRPPCSMPIAICWRGWWNGWARPRRISAFCPMIPNRLAPAIALAAQSHDLVLTSGGVSTGEADHVRHALERIGRLVFVESGDGAPAGRSRWASSRGATAGAMRRSSGLPGNPAAVYVTFARVVRPLLLRLAGAVGTGLVPMPVRAAFSYKKKAGRREYVRVKLARSADRTVEAFKHAQEGSGISRPSLRPTVSSSCRKRPPGSSPAQAWAFSPTRPWWVRSSAEVGENLLPLTNRVASLLKRWLLGTHQGAVSAEHLDYYLDEYTFRFNRRTSGSRGLLFLRLMQQAVDLSPVPAKDILGGRRPAKINRLIELEFSA